MPRRISIVIPTLNRPAAVVDAVRDFQAQDWPNLEIIAVGTDVSENQALQDILRRDPRVRTVVSDSTGTCHARNLGVRAATGDVVLFVDDDCRMPDRNFVRAHDVLYVDVTIGGVGGRVIDRNLALNKPSRGPVCRVSRTGAISPNSLGTKQEDINAPRGGNMSFRREVILAMGGFDERFRGNAMREETDFSLRVVEGGWRIVFTPAAENIHLALPGGTRTKDRISWYEDFFFNETLFFLKHFSRWLLPTLFLRKLRAVIACWTWYGRLRPRALRAPIQAFNDGAKLARQPMPPYLP